MNLEGLQIFSHEVSGYKPQVDFNTWRVALLNASDMYLPNNITYFDNHLETDEVFILLSGSCALLLASSPRWARSMMPSARRCLLLAISAVL